MEDITFKPEYPGGWVLTDDSCMQYVRRHGALEFELIEYSKVSQDGPMYEVYKDYVDLSDYEQAEIEDILKSFGYENIEAVYASYPTRNEANQVIAECIFEHYGSFHAEQLCEAVPEAFAQKTILDYVLLHHDIPEHHWDIEVSMEELVEKMLALKVGESMDFAEDEVGNAYGVIRVKHFDAEMFLINYYGGGNPFVIETTWSETGDLATDALTQFKSYCTASSIEFFFMTSQAAVDPLPDVAHNMRNRNREALLSKDELMEQLCEGDYTDRELSHIRDVYMEKLGFDLVWRYPFCHDGGLGAVLIPVKEGFLWLPYNIIDIDDNEIYDAENASLLDAESCEYLLQDMQEYVGSLTDVMRYVADELKGEANT